MAGFSVCQMSNCWLTVCIYVCVCVYVHNIEREREKQERAQTQINIYKLQIGEYVHANLERLNLSLSALFYHYGKTISVSKMI